MCNRYISSISRVIIYQILIRPILTYVAPVLWNLGAAEAENLRKFERNSLRTVLFLHRSYESQFLHRVSNTILYNKANITRIDNFIIKLTRDYFASTQSSYNDSIKGFSTPDPILTSTTINTGYIQPEAFILHDRLGIIQDYMNIPILMHWKRHSANNRIPPSYAHMMQNTQNFIYNTTIPNRDKSDIQRLHNKYFWLDDTAAHIINLKRRLGILDTRPHRKRKKNF
ncbi:hypothetical protein KPH14_010604 [Odynerus spinipes]|uniref:Uncharacterized protein n=1 Tax=Odynerus spinipes TaxID=1348599 RepID=A0AAD9RJ15_9HYME|nr:hypothetical protein KPH14_010604 [Odynerus spinipes]